LEGKAEGSDLMVETVILAKGKKGTYKWVQALECVEFFPPKMQRPRARIFLHLNTEKEALKAALSHSVGARGYSSVSDERGLN
jgi:hypothetical protein